MYICVCNKLNEELIRELINEGWTLKEIIERTGCSACCGCCKTTLIEIFQETTKQYL